VNVPALEAHSSHGQGRLLALALARIAGHSRAADGVVDCGIAHYKQSARWVEQDIDEAEEDIGWVAERIGRAENIGWTAHRRVVGNLLVEDNLQNPVIEDPSEEKHRPREHPVQEDRVGPQRPPWQPLPLGRWA